MKMKWRVKILSKNVDQYSEYTIDDTLDSLTRLEKYHSSDFSLQRYSISSHIDLS
jgi:hypothetical protein